PPVMARNAIPAPPACLKQSIPGAHSLAAPPQVERLASCAAGMHVKHAADVTIVGYKRLRMGTQRLFIKNRPIFQDFPGSRIPSATALAPLLPVIGHLCSGAMQHIGQPLFLPTLPLLRRPVLPLQGLFDQTFGFRAVAPRA